MLWTHTKRVIKSGFINFWRNGFVSLASILVMVITLLVVGSVIFSSAILKTSLDQIKHKVDVNAYFVTDASENDVLNIKKALEALPEVASVTYISREQALENFRKLHEDEEATIQALEEVNGNPLGAVLNIKAKDPSQYQGIDTFLKSKGVSQKDGMTILDKVTYQQNKKAIDTLTRFIDAGQRLGIFITVVLGIISVLIVFNTIRLAIYISRDEISIMRLVGASSKFVRGPFVIIGIMYGVTAAILAMALFYPITFYLGRKTEDFFSGVNIFDYYISNFGQIFLILLAVGVVSAAFSSWLAVRRYLKV